MQARPLLVSSILVASALAAVAAPAHAQSGGRPGTATAYGDAPGSRSSWLPYTRDGYVGLNVGRSDFSGGCGGLPGLGCDDSDTAFKVYTGGMFHPYFGAEIGYLNMGRIDRAGGTTKAHGINLSLVGRVPLAERFHAFAKLGTTYGRTKVSAAAGSGVASGSENGFGLAYGAGLGIDVHPRVGVVLEWERHNFNFAGGGDDAVNAASLGVKFRF